MGVINLIDESFDIKKVKQYHLSILSSEKNTALAVLDTNSDSKTGKQGKYIALLSCLSFEELWKSSPFERADEWKSISCAVAHTKFTLTPSSLFDEESKKKIFEFNHALGEDDKLHSDNLHELEAKNIFAISRTFEADMRKRFKAIHFLHNATAFAGTLLVQNRNNLQKKVFVNFHTVYFEVVIFFERDIVFCNSFEYKTPEDIAYYILFIYEQLKLNTDSVELLLSGEIQKSSAHHELLYTYIKHIQFVLRPVGFQYSHKLEDIPSHKFYSLFTQYLCA